jgi:hypothetical protein
MRFSPIGRVVLRGAAWRLCGHQSWGGAVNAFPVALVEQCNFSNHWLGGA